VMVVQVIQDVKIYEHQSKPGQKRLTDDNYQCMTDIAVQMITVHSVAIRKLVTKLFSDICMVVLL